MIKIVLLVLLSVFAYQDIKYRSVSAKLACVYVIIWFVGVMTGWISIIEYCLIPGITAAVMHLIKKDAIGLGDVVMIGLVGMTLGLSDSYMVLAYSGLAVLIYLVIRKAGRVNTHFLRGKSDHLKASITIEAAVLVPLLMFITISLINGAVILHEKVKEKSEMEWDRKYCLEIKRWATLGEELAD